MSEAYRSLLSTSLLSGVAYLMHIVTFNNSETVVRRRQHARAAVVKRTIHNSVEEHSLSLALTYGTV